MVEIFCNRSHNDNTVLIIKNKYVLYSINLEDIYYFEKDNKKIKIRTNNKTLTFYGSFIELENLICKNSFFCRCHKSFIVNYNKILLIDKDEIFFNNIKDVINVSSNYKDYLVNMISNY
jgi:DNA-binding LytR/AlgR family response regulator